MQLDVRWQKHIDMTVCQPFVVIQEGSILKGFAVILI